MHAKAQIVCSLVTRSRKIYTTFIAMVFSKKECVDVGIGELATKVGFLFFSSEWLKFLAGEHVYVLLMQLKSRWNTTFGKKKWEQDFWSIICKGHPQYQMYFNSIIIFQVLGFWPVVI